MMCVIVLHLWGTTISGGVHGLTLDGVKMWSNWVYRMWDDNAMLYSAV